MLLVANIADHTWSVPTSSPEKTVTARPTLPFFSTTRTLEPTPPGEVVSSMLHDALTASRKTSGLRAMMGAMLLRKWWTGMLVVPAATELVVRLHVLILHRTA